MSNIEKNKQQIEIWQKIVQNFSGGQFGQASPDEVAASSGKFLSYDLIQSNRRIRFTIQNLSGQMFVSVDFQWIKGMQPAASLKDKIAAQQMQPGSKQLLQTLKSYSQMCKQANLRIRFNAEMDKSTEHDRREKLYNKGLSSVGYNRMKEPLQYIKTLPPNAYEHFKSWLENNDDDYDYETAERYFSIGHGGDCEDEPFIVWTIINGIVKASRKLKSGDSNGTHGSIWGHNVTDKNVKGRYEPNTGRLSIAIPSNQDVPKNIVYQDVLPLLEKKFKTRFDRNKVEIF
jgi:hypothetical protein